MLTFSQVLTPSMASIRSSLSQGAQSSAGTISSPLLSSLAKTLKDIDNISVKYIKNDLSNLINMDISPYFSLVTHIF